MDQKKFLSAALLGTLGFGVAAPRFGEIEMRSERRVVGNLRREDEDEHTHQEQAEVPQFVGGAAFAVSSTSSNSTLSNPFFTMR